MASSFGLFCIAFLALTSQQILTNADLITEVCAKAVNKEVCQSTFAGSQNADLTGLANIALDSATKESKNIQLAIVEAAKSADKALQPRLTDCSNDYESAIGEFDKSKKALGSNKYSDVNAFVSAAMTSADECQDEFEQLSGGKLADMNYRLKGICSSLLAIANKLDGKI